MTLNLQEVARAVGAGAQPPPLDVAGWSVDTRTQNPGDVYFALRGPNHDGHNFLGAAIEKGASAVGGDRAPGLPRELIGPGTGRGPQEVGPRAGPKWGGKGHRAEGRAGQSTAKWTK